MMNVRKSKTVNETRPGGSCILGSHLIYILFNDAAFGSEK